MPVVLYYKQFRSAYLMFTSLGYTDVQPRRVWLSSPLRQIMCCWTCEMATHFWHSVGLLLFCGLNPLQTLHLMWNVEWNSCLVNILFRAKVWIPLWSVRLPNFPRAHSSPCGVYLSAFLHKLLSLGQKHAHRSRKQKRPLWGNKGPTWGGCNSIVLLLGFFFYCFMSTMKNMTVTIWEVLLYSLSD